MGQNRMNDTVTQSIRESYDRLADEYACRIFTELQHKPLDRELLNRFVAEIAGSGEACDMGCGPGHVARYLHDAGAAVFGLDISPRMLEQARQFNPDISFQEGNMMALDLQDGALAGIAAFYAIVNNSECVTALGISGDEEGAATGGTAIACISYWGRNPSRG
jgi:ubiquinone/menaquinone biosynthesis C-methylase UbiE